MLSSTEALLTLIWSIGAMLRRRGQKKARHDAWPEVKDYVLGI
jgi:hypothetical protein